MKLHYYPETDSLYIELKSAPGAETREIAEGLLVDFDAKGEVVGLDIDRASKKLDPPQKHGLENLLHFPPQGRSYLQFLAVTPGGPIPSEIGHGPRESL